MLAPSGDTNAKKISGGNLFFADYCRAYIGIVSIDDVLKFSKCFYNPSRKRVECCAYIVFSNKAVSSNTNINTKFATSPVSQYFEEYLSVANMVKYIPIDK